MTASMVRTGGFKSKGQKGLVRLRDLGAFEAEAAAERKEVVACTAACWSGNEKRVLYILQSRSLDVLSLTGSRCLGRASCHAKAILACTAPWWVQDDEINSPLQAKLSLRGSGTRSVRTVMAGDEGLQVKKDWRQWDQIMVSQA